MSRILFYGFDEGTVIYVTGVVGYSSIGSVLLTASSIEKPIEGSSRKIVYDMVINYPAHRLVISSVGTCHVISTKEPFTIGKLEELLGAEFIHKRIVELPHYHPVPAAMAKQKIREMKKPDIRAIKRNNEIAMILIMEELAS